MHLIPQSFFPFEKDVLQDEVHKLFRQARRGRFKTLSSSCKSQPAPSHSSQNYMRR